MLEETTPGFIHSSVNTFDKALQCAWTEHVSPSRPRESASDGLFWSRIPHVGELEWSVIEWVCRRCPWECELVLFACSYDKLVAHSCVVLRYQVLGFWCAPFRPGPCGTYHCACACSGKIERKYMHVFIHLPSTPVPPHTKNKKDCDARAEDPQPRPPRQTFTSHPEPPSKHATCLLINYTHNQARAFPEDNHTPEFLFWSHPTLAFLRRFLRHRQEIVTQKSINEHQHAQQCKENFAIRELPWKCLHQKVHNYNYGYTPARKNTQTSTKSSPWSQATGSNHNPSDTNGRYYGHAHTHTHIFLHMYI